MSISRYSVGASRPSARTEEQQTSTSSSLREKAISITRVRCKKRQTWIREAPATTDEHLTSDSDQFFHSEQHGEMLFWPLILFLCMCELDPILNCVGTIDERREERKKQKKEIIWLAPLVLVDGTDATHTCLSTDVQCSRTTTMLHHSYIRSVAVFAIFLWLISSFGVTSRK